MLNYRLLLYLWLVLLVVSCQEPPTKTTSSEQNAPRPDSLAKWQRFFLENPDYWSDGFDYPVGPPDGKGYYNAQAFGRNDHLGDDWNATTGGNSDLGDPIYSVANGYVLFAKDIGGGWGNIMRVIHQLDDSSYVECLYAHCDSFVVAANTGVKRGQQIATIGNCHGAYYAHLHFEIRDSIEMEVGGGYSSYNTGYLDPTKFIKKHRPKTR